MPEPHDGVGPRKRRAEVLALSGVVLLLVAVIVVLNPQVIAGRLIRGIRGPGSHGKGGTSVAVSVETSPKVSVRVRHGEKCDSPEPFTDLGMTPIRAAWGAHLLDTLILENKELGIYAEDEEALSFGESGETKVVKHEFETGSVRLKVTPPMGLLKIFKGGQEIGVYLTGGSRLELMEGTHTLDLRGGRLTAPVRFEVAVKAFDTTEITVDVSRALPQPSRQ